ncbi:hypothetical protein MMC31_004747 [Peltigera leucophlebia]|nr:hypothetical protein [Peltigera leucophlebia]
MPLKEHQTRSRMPRVVTPNPAPTAVMASGQQLKRGKVGSGGKGKGLGKGGMKRHRRLARRGGVKRISAGVYDEVRVAMEDRLRLVLKDCAICVEHAKRKTIMVSDVVFALKRASSNAEPPPKCAMAITLASASLSVRP